MTATLTRRTRGLHPSITMPTDRMELAYLAGVVDAKGTIATSRSGSWYVQVGAPSRALVGLFLSIGGRVEPEGQRIVWRLTGSVSVARFLVALLPYLQATHRQAEACVTQLVRGGA